MSTTATADDYPFAGVPPSSYVARYWLPTAFDDGQPRRRKEIIEWIRDKHLAHGGVLEGEPKDFASRVSEELKKLVKERILVNTNGGYYRLASTLQEGDYSGVGVPMRTAQLYDLVQLILAEAGKPQLPVQIRQRLYPLRRELGGAPENLVRTSDISGTFRRLEEAGLIVRSGKHCQLADGTPQPIAITPRKAKVNIPPPTPQPRQIETFDDKPPIPTKDRQIFRDAVERLPPRTIGEGANFVYVIYYPHAQKLARFEGKNEWICKIGCTNRESHDKDL